MKTFHKLFDWYFTRKAMPYWCILMADYALLLASGFIAYAL